MSIRDIFLNLFDELTQVLIKELPNLDQFTETSKEYLEKLIRYNVPKGKLTRGLGLVNTFVTIVQTQRKVTKTEIRLSMILGWCIEWLQASLLVADDYLDQSLTRRGQKCWYRVVGIRAINDALLLESCLYVFLKKYFKKYSSYRVLLELFLSVTFKTELGQTLDLSSVDVKEKPIIEKFNVTYYNQIVRLKTSYYSFYLPVSLGIALSSDFVDLGIDLSQLLEQVKNPLIKMGELFQVQDDYLDNYGETKIIGKHGTDIQDGKCSWLIVNALEIANEKQKEILINNYSKQDKECIEKIKTIYDELNLKKLFIEYQEKSFQEIQLMITKLTHLPKSIFENLLNKIYKRQK
ncbi:farnesyl-pyrophosphate synthetase [Anaeramoeba flamelloides]|uniref:Farnesyl-pyrophosphate synthetase n=1 Tax=Anaeramoeba flamelloides TaxID=1746091 RepID=A0AAV7Y3G8_9EUKA|nr:farnesyl-pyrophosphate synthetase [Anaeramoeba flamelloides]KAJ6227933.1 farnesyl-pyrophosphate synthetase [Anaeramoeba flamelloides]